MATLWERTSLVGPAMQINRLNLIFPPTTPGTPGASAQPDALQADAGNTRSPSADLGAVPSRKAAVVESSAPAAVAGATAGVTLALGSGQKAAASGIYTREGVFAGRASAAVDQTPAEQFVASAVNILRDFDASKIGLGSAPAASAPAEDLSANRFGGLRQAVAKLNVFA